jgi:hypothetical protein
MPEYIITGGYHQTPDSAAFFRLWYDNTLKYARPKKVFVINAGGEKVDYGEAEWINVGNLGHVMSMPKKQKLAGCMGCMLTSLLLAYQCKCDWIYKESDCLAFGPYVDVLYRDLKEQGALALVGKLNWNGGAKNLQAQSLLIVKWEYALEFIQKYLSIPMSDAAVIPEFKFRHLQNESFGRIGTMSLDYDRSRPIDYERPAFYAQKLTADELAALKARQLI